MVKRFNVIDYRCYNIIKKYGKIFKHGIMSREMVKSLNKSRHNFLVNICLLICSY